MAPTVIGQTLGALRASREEAELLLRRAAVDAGRIERDGAARAREQAAERLREIESLRVAIAEHAEQTELAAIRLAEAMAAAAAKLVELAREADFSPPPWSGHGSAPAAPEATA